MATTIVLIILTTTSIMDSGLLEKLIPVFEYQYHCKVKTIAVGSGAAFRIAKEGNGDLLIVHEPDGEKDFVKKGFGVKRYPFMWNEFVLCGPENDPAGIAKSKDVFAAFKKIYQKQYFFVSRDDDSGTHKMEKKIWNILGLNPEKPWYIKTGNGMIEALRIAEEKNAYILTDHSTFLYHRKEFKNVTLLLRDRKNLKNIYSFIPVSPLKFPHSNYDYAMKFINFVLYGKGKEIIKKYPEPLNPLFYLLDENND